MHLVFRIRGKSPSKAAFWHVVADAALGEPRSADFVAGVPLREPSIADFVARAGAALSPVGLAVCAFG